MTWSASSAAIRLRPSIRTSAADSAGCPDPPSRPSSSVSRSATVRRSRVTVAHSRPAQHQERHPAGPETLMSRRMNRHATTASATIVSAVDHAESRSVKAPSAGPSAGAACSASCLASSTQCAPQSAASQAPAAAGSERRRRRPVIGKHPQQRQTERVGDLGGWVGTGADHQQPQPCPQSLPSPASRCCSAGSQRPASRTPATVGRTASPTMSAASSSGHGACASDNRPQSATTSTGPSSSSRHRLAARQQPASYR